MPKVYVKASPEGVIEEAQRLPAHLPMPEGYTHEISEDKRPEWSTLLRHGGNAFYMDGDELRGRDTVEIMASADRSPVGTPVVVHLDFVPPEVTEVLLRVNGVDLESPLLVSLDDTLELDWSEPATVRVELSPTEIRLRATPIFITFEEPLP
jgi:hypothetical protein